MYVELLKAGTVRAARLFWEKLTAKLVLDWGFTANPYNPCVMNKIISGTQLTVAWHWWWISLSMTWKENLEKRPL
jgi:hypothetical protein